MNIDMALADANGECNEDYYYKWTQNDEEIEYNLFDNGHTL